MPHIRLRHNYRKYILSENGVEQSSPIIGNSVEVDRSKMVKFGGFKTIYSTQALDSLDRCQVTNIEAYTFDPKGMDHWIDLPRNSHVAGFIDGERCVIPILAGRFLTG